MRPIMPRFPCRAREQAHYAQTPIIKPQKLSIFVTTVQHVPFVQNVSRISRVRGPQKLANFVSIVRCVSGVYMVAGVRSCRRHPRDFWWSTFHPLFIFFCDKERL